MDYLEIGVDYNAQHRETFPNVALILRNFVRNTCNRNLIFDRLPILKWLPKYKASYFLSDLCAGITVGLTAISQGIAYANIAGLDPEYGLYSGIAGVFVYIFLGTCKDITIGPTAIMSLVLSKYVNSSVDFAVLATFISGIFVLLLGVLNLGFVVQFISVPVTIGFTAGAAVTVAASQIKPLLGLPGSSSDFIEAILNTVKYIEYTQLWDTILGVAAILFLVALKYLGNIKGRWANVFKSISLSRNALVVFLGTGIAYGVSTEQSSPFTLTGTVRPGLPEFKPPPFSTTVGTEILSFGDMISGLGASLAVIPLIAVLEIIAISKTFAKGKRVDATQELIALGMSNVCGSFISSMPITGSLSRCAVNYASGVQTQLGGLFTGGLILISLEYLTEVFRFIPKTILAAVIVTAIVHMIDIEGTITIWKTRRADMIPLLFSFFICVFLGLEYGILVGVAVNIIFILYSTARPNVKKTIEMVYDENILIVTPDQSLVFCASEHVKEKILKYINRNDDKVKTILIDGHHVHKIDITVAKNLKQLADELKQQNKEIFFWNWKQQPTGIAWRLNKEFGLLFHQSNSITEMIEYSKSLPKVHITK